jgi:hypothetical protein
MHRQIATVAGHEMVAESLQYVDFSDTDLERLAAERAAEMNRSRFRL